ncbi:MAG: hypothetical protein PF444_02055 [Bacteroidales bacterium]|jgi:hypothetical protein|nr:hypothetical protein [Bacteroidales bacterium]
MNSGNWIYKKLKGSPVLIDITGGDIFPIRRPKSTGDIPEIVYVFFVGDYTATKSQIVGKKMTSTIRALAYDYDKILEMGKELDLLFKFGMDIWADDDEQSWKISYSVEDAEPKYDFENKIYYVD